MLHLKGRGGGVHHYFLLSKHDFYKSELSWFFLEFSLGAQAAVRATIFGGFLHGLKGGF
jgi:hypothetical protein